MIDSPPTVRRFAANEWRAYRALRLHALRDAPDAFGSTLAREEAFPDDEWVQRLERGAGSPMDLPLIAEDDSQPIGLAWVRIDPRDGKTLKAHEIFKGVTSDAGETWSWTPITADSPVDNLRPVVCLCGPSSRAILWFRGTMSRSQHYDSAVVGIIERDQAR